MASASSQDSSKSSSNKLSIDTAHNDVIVCSHTHTHNFFFTNDTKKYDDAQHDVQMDYYSKRIATCSSDRTVKIFSVDDPRQAIATLTGTFFIFRFFFHSTKKTHNTYTQVIPDQSGKYLGHILNLVYF